MEQIRSTRRSMAQFFHITFGVRPNRPLVQTRNVIAYHAKYRPSDVAEFVFDVVPAVE